VWTRFGENGQCTKSAATVEKHAYSSGSSLDSGKRLLAKSPRPNGTCRGHAHARAAYVSVTFSNNPTIIKVFFSSRIFQKESDHHFLFKSAASVLFISVLAYCSARCEVLLDEV
jgi:hypothetical protein